ncbi:MAG: membrane protein insertase YidC [Oscillospiraceae bacterium]|nr:membrane protein insertase YidC [Oscillospiraceae bacterium]
MGFFGVFATPLGYVMSWIYDMVLNYGWAIIIFTLVVRLLSFPLQLNQQKTMAKNSVFQPMMMEIQKKYAHDRMKQNEELQRLQQEYGFNPSAGCLPMAINMFVIFGVIEVVYRPLRFVLHLGEEAIDAAISLAGIQVADYTAQSTLIQIIKGMTPEAALGQFGSALNAEQIALIQNFEMNFLGIDLCAMPELSFAKWTLLIFPVLSVLSMLLVNAITMKMAGNDAMANNPTMKYMPWIMSLMFVWFCFKVPVAFSLYYTISNILMFLTNLLAKKIYDPEKEKAKYAEELKQKKLEKKKKHTVTVTDKEGKEVTREVNQAELNKLRLERARALDEEKYKDERTEPLTKKEEPNA